jgi:hypothetical protein
MNNEGKKVLWMVGGLIAFGAALTHPQTAVMVWDYATGLLIIGGLAYIILHKRKD